MDLQDCLKKLIELQGSDLYITSGALPMVRVEGKISPLSIDVITRDEAQKMIYADLTESQIQEFEKMLELNIALHIPNSGRFRINVFRQRSGISLVARHIKTDIPSIDELGLPEQLKEFITEPRGLILLVGGTGTGKSTTLASMIDYRARQQADHILTVEDPIEFIHEHHQSLINQREVGLDTHSYAAALKNAMREAPDVIMVGEIRDAATMKHALMYAETGHLCLSTLHANSANQALDRIINFFPFDVRNQILADISLYLRVVVGQRLCDGIEGKRVATTEIMINTPHISDLIQKGKLHEIKAAMSKARHLVHQTFDDDLYKLCLDGKITQEEALRNADSRTNLALMFRQNKQKFVTDETEAGLAISYNREAPFDEYMTFRIQPLKVSDEQRADQVKLLSKALLAALKSKGLRFNNESADIVIQYVYELKDIKGPQLESTKLKPRTLSEKMAVPKKDAALTINIRDINNDTDIWRLSVTRRLSASLQTQSDYNEDMVKVLKKFPPEYDDVSDLSKTAAK
ncbi:MAG: PilT/PilU family type 4a pilus ATPase [Proteobacteria bacterium]|nr:PilT/PilU family type 4a pilus ATPase [Pseudomonadota bacterium]